MKSGVSAAAPIWVLALLLALTACNLSTVPGPSSQTLAGAPVVRILAPLPNATYLEGVAINLQAQVDNAGPDLVRVEFAVDDRVFASLEAPNEAGATMFNVSESWVSAGAGAHTLSVIAMRGDGSASDPGRVAVTVVSQVAQQQPAESGAGDGGSDAGQPRPAPTPVPERPAPAPTSDRPMARVLRGANVRSGPDTRFAPPIGSIAAGDDVELLAINIHKTWYKIKYYNGDGWVFGSLLETRGNLDDLPVIIGPPLPEPTAIPATATPALPAAGDINLVAGNMRNSAGTIICNVSFTVAVDVANHGSARAPGGTVRFLDYATKRDGGRLDPEDTITTGTFPPIDPGQTVEASASFTITRHYGERHIIWANVNHDGAVPEANKSDNENHFTYDLQRGDC